MAANPVATEARAARAPAKKQPCPANLAGKTRPSVRRSSCSRQARLRGVRRRHIASLLGLKLVAPEKADTRRTAAHASSGRRHGPRRNLFSGRMGEMESRIHQSNVSKRLRKISQLAFCNRDHIPRTTAPHHSGFPTAVRTSAPPLHAAPATRNCPPARTNKAETFLLHAAGRRRRGLACTARQIHSP